jgi:antitoxin (DNA-binding transcriptional repressor) of toxin-antitoxin stability system
MSHVLTIEQASERLGELVRGLAPGDEIVITENEKPIARIVPDKTPAKREPALGKGKLETLDDSDDIILEHLKRLHQNIRQACSQCHSTTKIPSIAC